MEHKSGCLFCGKELRYLDGPEELPCIYCKGPSPPRRNARTITSSAMRAIPCPQTI